MPKSNYTGAGAYGISNAHHSIDRLKQKHGEINLIGGPV